MSATAQVRVPDIGDLTDVPVIEINVSPGDIISEGDTLVVLESDKATLEIPADVSGKVITVDVVENDKVNKGSTIATIAPEDQSDSATLQTNATTSEVTPVQESQSIVDDNNDVTTTNAVTTAATISAPQTSPASHNTTASRNSSENTSGFKVSATAASAAAGSITA